MISRRNIRVKVMQELYALQSREVDGVQEKANPVEALKKSLDLTTDLFVYLLYFITEVARYAEKDAKLRASRNLPSFADKNVNTRIAGNELLWRILENESFKKEIAGKTIAFEDTEDMTRKIYLDLASSENYKHYILAESRDKKAEKDIIVFIFTNLMLPNESFVQHIEEHFANWDDDAEMIDQLMMSYLQRPGSYNLQQMVGEEKWKFAKDLLVTAFNKRAYTLELIKPKLKNWDSDRIAALDMILMQMGVCEFLYFETIPPKVTINEYIDIAKEYSTQQSGQFINGILDSIHKDLVAENKIHKIDFKQKA
ncbi:transcription antitermination factor NusB [Panacibacter sp. DH6]|uniref:Transcription antitermination factor NusB n=1 Tax=Panacibacter microcysteis TaxID=2793269 RepID=A0A931MF59_9BACT|nr:transcription antitermination factor NusB [Panacibacter microcysteis]MBG9378714.1 transcription antitermination factor NusB [Panacibacter microcysteis]